MYNDLSIIRCPAFLAIAPPVLQFDALCPGEALGERQPRLTPQALQIAQLPTTHSTYYYVLYVVGNYMRQSE